MSNPFFDHPIINSPHATPSRYWELDDTGQPTQQIIESRRPAKFIMPFPKPKKRKGASAQEVIVSDKPGHNTHKELPPKNQLISKR